MMIELIFWGVLHLGITLIYHLIVAADKSRIGRWTETCIVFMLPFFGAAILGGAKLLNRSRVYEKPDPHKLQNDAIVFSDNVKYDADIIPLNDTLFVDSGLKKRRFFADAIKQNVLDNQEILQQAIHDEDREVTYYAISMITTRLEEIESQMAVLKKRLDNRPGEEEKALLKEYAENIKAYIGQRFIDPLSRRQKEEIYSEVLERLIALEPGGQDYYEEKIRQDISLKKYPIAKMFCDRFQELHSETELPLLMYIHFYQATHDKENLQKKIVELKSYPGRLTGEALRVIRFWDEEAAEHE
jgi:hypothetical protein